MLVLKPPRFPSFSLPLFSSFQPPFFPASLFSGPLPGERREPRPGQPAPAPKSPSFHARSFLPSLRRLFSGPLLGGRREPRLSPHQKHPSALIPRVLTLTVPSSPFFQDRSSADAVSRDQRSLPPALLRLFRHSVGDLLFHEVRKPSLAMQPFGSPYAVPCVESPLRGQSQSN